MVCWNKQEYTPRCFGCTKKIGYLFCGGTEGLLCDQRKNICESILENIFSRRNKNGLSERISGVVR